MPVAYLIVEMNITDMAHYKQLRQKRVGATEYFNMVLVEGVAAPV